MDSCNAEILYNIFQRNMYQHFQCCQCPGACGVDNRMSFAVPAATIQACAGSAQIINVCTLTDPVNVHEIYIEVMLCKQAMFYTSQFILNELETKRSV